MADKVDQQMEWLDWAVELQALAQTGLEYTKDKFDQERFERIREIAAQMMSAKSGLSMETVRDLFCNETGFQTPKIDTRAAIFEGDKVLLVKEIEDGKWTMPGGWVDVDQSVRTNVEKEVKEEAGLDVKAARLIAVQDRNKRNYPRYAYGICKIFVLCNKVGGEFHPNIEISETGYFSLDKLPELSTGRVTKEQIEMCFEAKADENWQVRFD